MVPSSWASRRNIFLHNDAARAVAFLNANPMATWVRTAEQRLAHLAGPWNEVHLDHELCGGCSSTTGSKTPG